MATVKAYIRFGDIPVTGNSKVRGWDNEEVGVSVWDSAMADGILFPVLPENPNEHAVHDYFSLLFSDRPVHVVVGKESVFKGHDGEPCLINPVVLETLPPYRELFERGES